MADPLNMFRAGPGDEPRDRSVRNPSQNRGASNQESPSRGVSGSQSRPARSPHERVAPNDPSGGNSPGSGASTPFKDRYATLCRSIFIALGILVALFLVYLLISRTFVFLLGSFNSKNSIWFSDWLNGSKSKGPNVGCVGNCVNEWDHHQQKRATVQPAQQTVPDFKTIQLNQVPWLDPDRRWSRSDFTRESQGKITQVTNQQRIANLPSGSQAGKSVDKGEDPEFWKKFGDKLSDLASSTKSLAQNKRLINNSTLHKEYEKQYHNLASTRVTIDRLRKQITDLLGEDDSEQVRAVEFEISRIREQMQNLRDSQPARDLEAQYKTAQKKVTDERDNLDRKNSAQRQM